MPVRYTDAPQAYDYAYVVVLDEAVAQPFREFGKPLRKVEIPEDCLAYQAGRYLSGCYVCLTKEQLPDYGDIWNLPENYRENGSHAR